MIHIYIYIYIYIYIKHKKYSPYIDAFSFFADLYCRVFANGQRDPGSIPGRVIPKSKKNGT